MKFNTFLLLLFTSFYFFNCNEKQKTSKKPIVKTNTLKDSIVKKKEEIIIKPWDSLDRQNTKAFFTEYGKQNKETKVLLKTKFGNIKLRLFNDTPIHRANFIFLTKIGYFNTTVFHRVAKHMVIQGGEAEGRESANYRNKYKNYKLPAEILKHRKHKYGALALAKNEEHNPHKLSNPFNFYIVNNKYGAHHLDGQYTIFGQVISGYSTIRKISNVKVNYSEWPIDDVYIDMEVIN